VPDLVRHIASFARFAASRTEREHHDADAMRELASKPLELTRGLELEWLGVAGYRLSYEGQTIYIDPYLSRGRPGRGGSSEPRLCGRHPPTDAPNRVQRLSRS
jgi:hypothetical protein